MNTLIFSAFMPMVKNKLNKENELKLIAEIERKGLENHVLMIGIKNVDGDKELFYSLINGRDATDIKSGSLLEFVKDQLK